MVVIPDGTYALGADGIDPGPAITIEGQPGQPRPVLTSSSTAVLLEADQTIRRLTIDANNIGASSRVVDLLASTSVAERVQLVARGTTGTVVQLRNGALLRDSTVWNKDYEFGVGVITGGTGANLRNVTVFAGGSSSHGVLSDAAFGANQTVSVRNVIARGVQGIVAADDSGGTEPDNVDVDVAHSNYTNVVDPNGEADIVLGPGNQTTAPSFVDSTTGDFHQQSGSVTIDAGTGAPTLLGTADFDDQARTQGAAIDIGADEFVPPPPSLPPSDGAPPSDGTPPSDTPPPGGSPPPTGDTDPPQTTITKGAPDTTDENKVKFKFRSDEAGSTFECKLDKRPFKPCASPRIVKGLDEGGHKFLVRATDPSGNTDPTAAKDKFKVLE